MKDITAIGMTKSDYDAYQHTESSLPVEQGTRSPPSIFFAAAREPFYALHRSKHTLLYIEY